METSKNERVKALCIKLLSKTKNDAEKEIFYNQMKEGSSDLVKAAAIRALGAFKPDENVLRYIQNNIGTISESDTRNEMVRYLIKTLNEYPENKEYLKDVLDDLQDKQTKKLIIKAIRSSK